jgi:peptide/nickel transport system permease protein
VGGLLRGETARSISYDTPTAELIAERLQVTLPLAVLAMGLTMVLALGLGSTPRRATTGWATWG